MRFLLVALAAGAAVLAVPATAHAQSCTQDVREDVRVASGEYAIVTFATSGTSSDGLRVYTAYYGPGSIIPRTLGASRIVSGVIINPRACATAASAPAPTFAPAPTSAPAPAGPLSPTDDPAKQFVFSVQCGEAPSANPFAIIAGPAVVTSIPAGLKLSIQQGNKLHELGQNWVGELRIPAGATFKGTCFVAGSAVVTGYRL